MSLIRMKFITQEFMRKHPDWLFVFGDNLERKGFGGQAYEMRGEPNAVGLPTKRGPAPTAFLSDQDYVRVLQTNFKDINNLVLHLGRGGVVVWPEDGIGTGRAQLEKHSLAILRYYTAVLAFLMEI